VNPYTRLLEKAREFESQVKFPRGIFGRYFGLKQVKDQVGFRLDETLIRVETADKLGYNTELRSTDLGLEVVFVKRPELPLF